MTLGPSRARPISGEAAAIAVPKRSMGSGARPHVSDKTPQHVCFLRVSRWKGWRGSSRRSKAAEGRQAGGVAVVDLAAFEAIGEESAHAGVGTAACPSGTRDVGGIIVQD